MDQHGRLISLQSIAVDLEDLEKRVITLDQIPRLEILSIIMNLRMAERTCQILKQKVDELDLQRSLERQKVARLRKSLWEARDFIAKSCADPFMEVEARIRDLRRLS